MIVPKQILNGGVKTSSSKNKKSTRKSTRKSIRKTNRKSTRKITKKSTRKSTRKSSKKTITRRPGKQPRKLRQSATSMSIYSGGAAGIKLRLEIVIDETKLEDWEFEELNNLLYNDFNFQDYLISYDYQSYLLKRDDPDNPTSRFIFEYNSDVVEDGLQLQKMLWNLDHNDSIKEFKITHH
jgi:hypothetical protein